MHFLHRLAPALALGLALAPAASAQTFTYSTGGCFASGASCLSSLPTTSTTNISAGATNAVKFTGVTNRTVGPINSNGYVPLDLGAFTFLGPETPRPVIGDGTIPFALWISFSSPSLDAPTVQVLDYGTSLLATANGSLGWVSMYPYRSATFNRDGSLYFLVAPDLVYPATNADFNPIPATSQAVTGGLDCSPVDDGDGLFLSANSGGVGRCGTPSSTVPEPATCALLAAGLGALGLVARRRRDMHA